MKKIIFPVTGMSCAACAASVESMTKAQEGVYEASVNFASSSVAVDYDEAEIDPVAIQAAIREIGYDLIIEADEEKKSLLIEEEKNQQYNSLKKQTIGAISLTIPIMVIAMVYPELPNANYLMLVLTLPVVFWFGRNFYLRAIKQIRHGMLTMDTLVALSTGIAFVFSLFNTVFAEFWINKGLSAHVYYEASAAIISFILIGKLLEERAKTSTGNAIRKLIKLQPNTVTKIKNDGSSVVIPIKEVAVGDKLLVKPGDKIPIDGQVISGETYIDESMITGEPIAVFKKISDKVFAGTINQKGSISIEAEKVGRETLLAQIIKMVQEAQGSKAPIQSLVDKVAAVFVPIVIGISLLTFIVWMIFGGENALSYALLTSVSVLVIACPCALGLATPTAIIVGMGKGADKNILIKDAVSLEKLTQVSAVIFDKTGTLTFGRPEVTDLIWLTETNKTSNLTVLQAIESRSEHPLASAIVNSIEQAANPPQVEGYSSITGKGVTANVCDQKYLVGNTELLTENGLPLDSDIVDQILKLEKEAKTVVLFADNSALHAIIAIADKLKDNAQEVIQTLTNHGIESYLLTGDQEVTASAVASQTNIKHYRAKMLPQQKADFVRALQADGQTVAMIGDGINDSEALAQADVSIAMGSGSDIAIDVAQITLRGSNLNTLPDAIALSEQTSRTIKQNLFWAFIYNLVGIPIAAGVLYGLNGFLLNPMIAAAAMAFSSVSVVTNSLFLKRKKLILPKKRRSKKLTLIRKEMHKYEFKTNINCNGCVAAVTPNLSKVNGLQSWSVDTDNPDKVLTVEINTDNPDAIKAAVESAGFNINSL